MNCASLVNTGLPVIPLIAAGAALLVAGVVVLLLTRGRRGRTAAIVLLLVIGGGLTGAMTTPSTAQADAITSVTASGEDCLMISQTSTMTGLAPGVAPVAITGTVTNLYSTSTLVTAVTVSITAVTKAAGGVGAAAGTCDGSDYVLLDPVMPVGRTLAPGQSVDFAGARIGFNDKSINQDACQSAVISLLYVSS